MTFKVAVCAGHGRNTPGKRSPDDEREWDFNDKVVDAFIKELLTYEGVEILRLDDPTGKTDVSLATRTKKANDWKADIYVSFHHNADKGVWGSATGVETLVQTGVKGKALDLAKLVHPEIVSAYGLKDRGIKHKDLHITRETKMPAILVEGGFMDSKTDIVKLRDPATLAKAGKGAATAVAKYGKLRKKPLEVYHTVRSGDTLWSISRLYTVGVSQIKVWNGLKTDTIRVGDKLRVK